MEDIAFSIELQEIAQDLAGVAFSLWRSVFLSDLNGDIAEQMADLKTFLGNLISNNTIAYPQDKNAKEFTFRYYLINAELRLDFIARKMPAILDRSVLEKKGTDAKDAWTTAQGALTLAINNFGEILSLF
jgi:hypothetical protein